MAKRPRGKGQWQSDLVAGFTFAAVNIPQGMANGALATVNPVLGLYSLMIATPVAALFSGAVFLNVSTTSALSAATASALVSVPGEQRTAALVTLVLSMGLFQLVLGVRKLGWLIRYVPNSVMIGFTNGVAILIILGQLGDLTGFRSGQNNAVFRALDLVIHFQHVQLSIFAVGALTLVAILMLQRSLLRNYALLLALLLASAVVFLLDTDQILIVRDIAEIPRALPSLRLPVPLLNINLIVSGMALAIVGLVQGAGVSQTYRNPDGKYADTSRDFLGQGVANMATSLVQGIPTGGSMSGSALMVQAGQRTRRANVVAGVFVAGLVLLFGNLIGLIPQAALAALLIVVGFQLLTIPRMLTVARTGQIPMVAMLITFAATLFVPLQYAVFTGVAVSILLAVFQMANKVNLVEIVLMPDGFLEEAPAPAQLPSNKTTVLYIYGSTYFAAASTLETLLPSAEDARHAVVILSLRGSGEVGSTFLTVVRRYAEALRASECELMLAGVDEHLYDQMERTHLLSWLGPDKVFRVQPRLGAAVEQAMEVANVWMAAQSAAPDTEGRAPTGQ